MDSEPDRLVGGRGGLRAAVTLALSLVACLSLPAAAGAEVVTIGTPTADFAASNGEASCNCTQYQLTAPSVTEAVPANGVIIDWRVSGSGSLTLEALNPSAGYAVVGSSAGGVSVAGNGFPAQPTHIPVQAGDVLGVQLAGNNAQVKNSGGTTPGATIGEILSVPSPFAPLTPAGLLFLNADVAITPVISSVTPNSGPTGGTNLVTITGQYLDGTTSVSFGTLPAAFTVISPTEITAYAPLQGPGMVDVTASGAGGSSAISSGDEFTYLPKPAAGQTQTTSGSGTAGSGTTGSGTPGLLSPLSLSSSAFLATPLGPSPKTATGTTISYTVSVPATTTILVEQVVSGRLIPAATPYGVGTCAPVNKATLPEKLPKCPLYLGLSPELRNTGPAGLNKLHWSGRLNSHALSAGSYRLVATATATADPSDVSAAVTHAFRIIAPPKPKPKSKPKQTTEKPTAHAALPSNGSGATEAPTD